MKTIFALILFYISLHDAKATTNNISAASINFQWIVSGKFAGDSDSLKATNGFGARLDLTEDEKFFARWDTPEIPYYTPVTIARRGVPIFTVVIFVDPGQRFDKTADVKIDTMIRKPDGSIYGQQTNMIGSIFRTDKARGRQQLAYDYMGIRIEPKDPAGIYTVEAVVKDNVKKVELHLTQKFTVEK